MASLAEGSASISLDELAALREGLMNIERLDSQVEFGVAKASAIFSPEANKTNEKPHLLPRYSRPAPTSTAASGEKAESISGSADASGQRAPPSDAPRPPPRLSASRSMPAPDVSSMVQPSPSQEIRAAMARAGTFHGYEGGDTQPNESQVYREYFARSNAPPNLAGVTPKKTVIWPQKAPACHAEEGVPVTDDKNPRTFVEGDGEYMNLGKEYDPPSPTARSTTSGLDELLASSDTQMRIASSSRKPPMPITPALAGHKRTRSGEVLTSATKTPGFSQLFGVAQKPAVMSATQMFAQTQAPSSPPPDAPRSDPVVTRPSPTILVNHDSSSPTTRSSPEWTMRRKPATGSADPADDYTSMNESQKRRQQREQEKHLQSLAKLEEEDDFENEVESARRRYQLQRMRRLWGDRALEGLTKVKAPSRPNSRPTSSRHQPTTIDLTTPALDRRDGHVTLEAEAEETDDDIPIHEDEEVFDNADGSDVVDHDMYDELGQVVLQSQRDCDNDGRSLGVECGDAQAEAVNGATTKKRSTDNVASPDQTPMTVTQHSKIVDSQPLRDEDTAKIAQFSSASIIPGSQYPATSSEDLMHRQEVQQDTSSHLPSSPPILGMENKIPEDIAETFLDPQHILMQPQRGVAEDGGDEGVSAGSLECSEGRPPREYSLTNRVNEMRHGESNSLPAPFSTARTHLSAAQVSPRKDSNTRSPFKTFASQQSGLSMVETPHRAAGLRDLVDAAGDLSQPRLTGETQQDVDEALKNLMTAEDQAFIELIASPTKEPLSKRRKAVQKLSTKSRLGVPTSLEDTGPLTDSEQPALPKLSELTESGKDGQISAKDSNSGQSSPSKGNDLPASTPDNVAPLQVTQDSVKKREEAGAHAVSQLLAARKTRPAITLKLSGRGRKAAASLKEKPTNDSSANTLVTRGTDDAPGEKDVNVPVELDHPATSCFKGSSKDAEKIDDHTVRPGPTVQCRDRILALFKGAFNNFYPATYLGTAHDGKSYKVRFDDTSTCNVDTAHTCVLDLRIGDTVKVDAAHMRKHTWIVHAFGHTARTDAERALGTDVAGHTTVKVMLKAGRNSISADLLALQQVDGLYEVQISTLYVTHMLWPAFKGRTFTPPNTGKLTTNRLATPSTGLQTPDCETPGSRSRRGAAKLGSRVSLLRDDSVSSRASLAGSRVFEGMAFAISYVASVAEKTEITRHIVRNGGQILESGFDELFELPDMDDGPTTPSKRNTKKAGVDDGFARGLRLRPEYANLGFVALIADRHSRRAKYMQALALGLPTVSGKWIMESLATVQNKAGEEPRLLDWTRYLLAAGESAHLEGAVRSRSLSLPLHSAEDSRLSDFVRCRDRLLNGDGVLIVASKKHKAIWERRKTYAFLTLALGAGRVRRVSDLTEAKAIIAAEGEMWKWVYVDGSVADASKELFGADAARAGSGAGGKKRKRGDGDEAAAARARTMALSATPADGRFKVVNDEFVVQSLILGALVG